MTGLLTKANLLKVLLFRNTNKKCNPSPQLTAGPKTRLTPPTPPKITTSQSKKLFRAPVV